MNNPFQDETLLARYLSGELSPEEQKQLQEWEGFSSIQRILSASEDLEMPPYPTEEQWQALQKRRVRPGRRFPMWVPYGLAAGIALLLGWFFFQQPATSVYQTGIAEQMQVTLPDGSTVELDEQTDLQFSKRNWSAQRTVELEGTAFFQVEKGEKFTVVTPNGNVEVLGTSFLVQTRANKLRVRCYTGMVGVDGAGAILPGEAVEVVRGELAKRWTLSSQDPPVLGEPITRFRETPLQLVAEEIAWRFNVNIELPEAAGERLFTGQILHQDLETALKMVCEPMGLRYEFKTEDQILLTQE